MKLKRVINLYGGPGCGKSTISAGLFYKMKAEGYSVEYVSEYAKDLTYEGRFEILQEDQLYIFGKQHRKIYRLKDQVEYIITDSPLLLPCVYYKYSDKPQIYDEKNFFRFVSSTYDSYPNMNIFIHRNYRYGYEYHGRIQSLKQAEELDEQIKRILLDFCGTFIGVVSSDITVDEIFEMIKE